MAILGNNSSSFDEFTAAAGRKVASKATSTVLAADATLTELHAYVKSGTGNTYVIHLHADSAGAPGTLLAYTSAIADAGSGSTIIEISQSGLSVALVAGTYWLGITFTNAQGFVRMTSGAGSGTLVAKLSGATVSPPSNPFGSTDFGPVSDSLSVWGVVGAAGGGSAFVPQTIVIT